MKKGFLFLLLLSTTLVYAQSREEREVAAVVERLNHALVDADSATLDQITNTALSYGHSTGKIEDKPTFIHNVVSGPFKYLSVTTTDQTIKLINHTAVVRHLFNAKATNDGAPVELKLGVLQVWQKEKGAWRLLARQGVKQ